MHVHLEDSWRQALKTEFEKPYWIHLAHQVKEAYLHKTIYPHPKNVFAALTLCPLSQVRVVILGQDPYHGPGQAHGLAFSVPEGVPIPPSLRNIFKEITRDIGTPTPQSGNLTRLTAQGVLLLNTTLTVQAGIAGSHHGLGWENFTDAVITTISKEREGVVFLLWGAYAQSKRPHIDETKHFVLTAPHPSPLSAHRGFLGCGHFSKTNTYLEANGLQPIIW